MSEREPLTREQRDEILGLLKARFEKNRDRHPRLDWTKVQARLEASPGRLESLQQMEQSGGDPDVVFKDEVTGEYVFIDCSTESPLGRRNLCYDRAALEARKENRPAGSAQDRAEAMGIELLTEEQYRALQKTVTFDTKTSSWLKTPDAIRARGGAIFGDRRYDTVFVYHNGADSYYSVRGFRGLLRV